ncbi:glycerate kinase [Nocardioides sp. R-C-SC26]|uniref:glycerate kinase family protein n=1 Tax=Nocardioides sp. R-C-SC26 TaxID=2870414 RepID=UPI001E323E1A|nr:glycerate kinase [Nocardioides sp. R-C-SC26]
MRVLVAPDKFAGTLTAVEAAEAIAAGWRRHAPGDTVDLAPMSDGGPGFVDVLHAALGGEIQVATVAGPDGVSVPASFLLVGETAYVESSQACGLHLLGSTPTDAATTLGVGSMLRHAVESGARRVVVGLGGSGTTDGGAGLLAGLGAEGDRDLTAGAQGLRGLTRVDLAPAAAILDGIEVVIASDVDNPLTGLFGAAKTYGPQKGLLEERIAEVDALLEQYATVVDRRLSLEKGAGAAGGLGFALLALGARREPGIGLVTEAVGLVERARASDLVITGEGAFDFSSRSGKVPYGVAEVAAQAVRPCIALAGQVLVGSREMRALGVESAYAMVDLAGHERAFAEPGVVLSELAERAARTWSR